MHLATVCQSIFGTYILGNGQGNRHRQTRTRELYGRPCPAKVGGKKKQVCQSGGVSGWRRRQRKRRGGKGKEKGSV